MRYRIRARIGSSSSPPWIAPTLQWPRFPLRALRVATCCLTIRTAVTTLLGVSVAVRLRFVYMLERERSGYCNHPRLEGGELSVGHVAEPFRDRIGRKMQIQGLRRAAITAV